MADFGAWQTIPGGIGSDYTHLRRASRCSASCGGSSQNRRLGEATTQLGMPLLGISRSLTTCRWKANLLSKLELTKISEDRASYRATRRLCGPANAKSTFRAMPSSKMVRCSGRLMLEMTR
jgi:hypothetical protein